MTNDRIYLCFVLLVISILLSACASAPPKLQPADPDFACAKDLNTDATLQTLRNTLKPAKFLPVHSNHEAYEWRLMLMESAAKTIDVQTFIWEQDESGSYIVERLIAAADRGVKVRLLVDDFLLAGRDAAGAFIDSHPNIEVRVFNPLGVRDDRAAFRGFQLLFNMSRLNHRMHNKLFVMDGEVAIVGGRNIGNEYYGISDHLNYRDFDMVAAGPIVSEITESFEVFWNSPGAYALKDVANIDNVEQAKADSSEKLKERAHASGVLQKEFDIGATNWEEKYQAGLQAMVEGEARVIYDCPPTVEDADTHQAAKILTNLSMSVEKELFLISHYLIPSKQFLAGLKELRDRGVRIRILTNSLESSDSAAAVSGYDKYREELLGMGIELHEMRADAGHVSDFKSTHSAAEFLSLHAKVIIFDRKAVYAGSLNLDPRSIVLNTEVGVLIKSEQLAETMITEFERDLLPSNSWLVKYDDKGDVMWYSSDEELNSTPARSSTQRWSLFFYKLFPIEDQL